MHRFRKKSDTKSVLSIPASDHEQPLDVLPELPTNDFRSSLILPDLSRRFSLLRSVGDSLLLDQLRSRLADQRTRGAENQITEEEEDMFLETLERIRPRNTPNTSQDSIDQGETGAGSSTTTSVSSSPSSRSTKRYSNNLFGSGRLRDYTYLKSVASSKGSASSSTRTVSLTPTEASEKTVSFRPLNPEASSNPSSSVQSSPNEQDGLIRSTPLVPSAPYGDQLQAITAAEYRLQKTLGPSVLKRASMALDEAIREIEDEVEDEILLPRSVPISGSLEQPTSDVRHSKASNASFVFEGGMAISIDQTIHDEFSDRRASPAPARTVPGYVPGMPRPMTPRDVEFDEQRSHSTTPRPQSPHVDPPSSPTPTGNISTSKKARRESASSISRSSVLTPVPATPLFLQRSTNGRYTPDDSHQSGDATDLDNPLNSALLGRRRPASPLSGQPYQPMPVSTRPPSRPSTPSNIIWASNPNNGHKNNHSIHSRNNSWIVDGVLNNSNSDIFGNSTIQPSSRLRSPPPDSQTTESSQGVPTTIGPQAYIPEVDFFGSPLLAHMHSPRSGTPTQTARRSPISPLSNFELTSRSGSRRSSKQQNPPSPFNTGIFPSLGFSPRANSSRSSLDSAGSSFHSWDEGDKVFSLFSDPKEKQPPAWHDFDTDKSSSATSGGVSADDEDWDPEEIIKRYAGLGKADLAAIQEKLVTAAFAKIANTDPRDRAPSSLRRRRPSTSQSNYSRIASPLPQPASPSPYPSDERSSKASALLNSMVESIKGQHNMALDTTTPPISTSDDKDLAPSPHSNRGLAHFLFGDDEPKEPTITITTTTNTTTTRDEPPQSKADPEPFVIHNVNPPLPTIASSPPPLSGESSKTTLISPSPYLLTRTPSLPRIPQKPKEEVDLTREVQQKADAAMIALKKDPSKVNLADTLKRSTSVRKRIDTSQISTPRLVSASTSVDTIPLRSPSISGNSTSGASKLSSRFRKLRGSLRGKNPPADHETIVRDPISAPATQTVYYDPAKLNVAGGPSMSSATETGRFKVPVPNPPSSAGPGLKGFMARFRNKQRMSEMPSGNAMSRAASSLSQSSPTSLMTPRQTEPLAKSNASITGERSHSSITRPAGQARPMYSRFPPANPVSTSTPPPTSTPSPPSKPPAETLNDSQSAAALEQLYAAAIDLGVDQDALQDLLARSGSTSARNPLPKNNSIQATPRQLGSREPFEQNIPTQVSYVSSTGSNQTTPTSYGPQSNNNYVASDNECATEEPATRKSSLRKLDYLRRPKEGQTDAAANAIVRRTIIYASDSGLSATEFAAMIQRKNSSRRRKINSVHDRAPTPPPPKTSSVKRFSADGMPPMPQIPTSLGQAEKLLNAPPTSTGGAIEKSNSTYDSLYDMYGGESRVPSMAMVDPNGPVGEQGAAESGPALEVVQMANGETIWSIVNGLRDADDESIYAGRASFSSEYSTREPGNEGGSTFVREHSRSGSKGSTPSFVSRKKPQQGKARPETKVFHSSSAQIGRLIESLSQGVDSGSFNFLPNTPNRGLGHSASSSLSTNDINWTVEERLDRMLGAMNNNNS